MHASPYRRRARGVWIVRIADGGRWIRQVTFGAEADAEARARAWAQAFNEREAARANLESGDRSRPVPWSAVCDDYLDSYVPELSKGTRRTAASRVAHLRLELAGEDLRDLTARDVRRVARALRAPRGEDAEGELRPVRRGAHGLSVETTIGTLGTLRRLVRIYGRGVLDGDPLAELGELVGQLRRAAPGDPEAGDPRDAWTRAELEQLLELAAGDPIRPVILAAAHTGARRGELLALRWSDVHLEARSLRIRRQLAEGEEKALKWRSRGAGRSVPISGPLLEELGRLRAGVGAKVVTVAGAGAPYVFRTAKGLRWHEGNFTRSWLRVRRRAAAKGVRPFPFHATRHTFITWALEAGRSVPWVASVVGASPEVILRTYAHAIRGEGDEVGFLEGGDGGQRTTRSRPRSRST